MKISPSLAAEVRAILNENKAERHIRGGMATKLKYIHEHSNNNGKVRLNTTIKHSYNKGNNFIYYGCVLYYIPIIL